MTMEIANTILEQLGGRKFLAMTGAKNLFGSDAEKTLQFQLSEVYADSPRAVFTETTGLETTLGTMGG